MLKNKSLIASEFVLFFLSFYIFFNSIQNQKYITKSHVLSVQVHFGTEEWHLFQYVLDLMLHPLIYSMGITCLQLIKNLKCRVAAVCVHGLQRR